jgi:VCBS repeat-containing protein
VSTLEDVPTSATLTASDPDGDPLTYSIASQPTMGSAEITNAATGNFTYTPDPNKTGTDNFSFKANDGTSDSNTATVTITIAADNDAPIAEAGTLTTDEDTPATNRKLNASDPDGDLLTYRIDKAPTWGSAVIDDPATGDYTYTPDPDENGPDSFTFIASDGSTDSNIATVIVTINPVNDPPVAVGSCGDTLQSDPEPYSGRLSANDLDSDLLLFSFPNGDTDTQLTTAKGVIEIKNDTTGDFTYTPLTNGDRGRDTFTYEGSDGEGVATATETVIVDQTIMPLGDSITMGSTFNGVDFGTDDSRVGYRKPLFETLGISGSGYTFDFVGSSSDGWALLPDSEHEGHGGWNAFEIAWGRDPDTEGVFNWLVDNPADIILLHAGTNDLANTTEFDIADILDEIERWENSALGNPVTVILARIIDQDPFDVVTDFNRKVKEMADLRINDDIIIVDQEIALSYPADMSDELHPNDNGYAKMANVWLDALTNVNPNTNEAVVDKCP